MMAAATVHHIHTNLLFSIIFLSSLTSIAFASSASDASFIHSSCEATHWPLLCKRTLSSYAPKVRRSPHALARTALAVSLHHAKSACFMIDRIRAGPTSTNLSEQQPETASKTSLSQRSARAAVKDCTEMMQDSVYRIQSSIKEMGHMGKHGSMQYHYHLSNVQTWVSAALTDESSCLDGIKHCGGLDRKVRYTIRRKIAGVSKITSNALALVNQMA